MEFSLTNNTKENAANVLRQAGYVLIKENQGEFSFIKSLSGNRFPRFHLYLKNKTGNQFLANLHLDQKAPTYGKQTAHSGEYEQGNPLLQEEAQKIISQFLAGV